VSPLRVADRDRRTASSGRSFLHDWIDERKHGIDRRRSELWGSALAPTVTGLVVQNTGSFVPVLVGGALIGIISAGCYLSSIILSR
jgi:hypothetical protein